MLGKQKNHTKKTHCREQNNSSGSSKSDDKVLVLTMDNHLTSVMTEVGKDLSKKCPGLSLEVFAASDWSSDEDVLIECKKSIENARLIFVSMLFMEGHFKPILEDLKARRDKLDALICIMSSPEVTRLTRMGRLDMSKPASGVMSFLKRFRNKGKNGGEKKPAGEAQMRMLRSLPKILKYIPGTAQDLRVFFLSLQYWLSGSKDNIYSLLCMLMLKYLKKEQTLQKLSEMCNPPKEYPDIGVYHPKMEGKISREAGGLPCIVPEKNKKGTVGLIVLRSYLLAGNTGHYDGVIAALESLNLQVIPCFSMGLDARPAIDKFFYSKGEKNIDALISLTGFSLVGGPAYNDSDAAKQTLGKLNVPYISASPLEFQSLDEWEKSSAGLLPVENTIMVAIPELDGAISPIVFGGRRVSGAKENVPLTGVDNHKEKAQLDRNMTFSTERVSLLARRVFKLINLRKLKNRDKKVGIVLFNFPPNSVNIGTAAHLDVFSSLFNTLIHLKDIGYTVDVPQDIQDLKNRLLEGNSKDYCSDANVVAKTSVDDYVSRSRWLSEIEDVWGVAPGKLDTDGESIFVQGLVLGNIFIGVQPAFGYEGDPMRLLLDKGHAPTHSFCNFYRYLRNDFEADVLLHYGTHGALEFMPGKQVGLSEKCWPDRLIDDLPNFYLYASNNPSEGTLAKRRIGATLISYMTPPVCEAGLYKGLEELKALINSFFNDIQNKCEEALEHNPENELIEMICEKATQLDLIDGNFFRNAKSSSDLVNEIGMLRSRLLEYEETLIPNGLHVVGGIKDEKKVSDVLSAFTKNWIESNAVFREEGLSTEVFRCIQKTGFFLVERVLGHDTLEITLAWLTNEGLERIQIETSKKICVKEQLSELAKLLYRTRELISSNSELHGISKALEGKFIEPAAGGDLLKNPNVLPTGRNIHGFDPFRIPSAFAVLEGARQADEILEKVRSDTGSLPETVAVVLWGTDNLKTEGSPIGQVLYLMGAKPRFDSYGRLAGAELIDLEKLGRPRIDVMVTLSGIFRDLLPLQIKTIAEAAFLAATADEPTENNFIRAHALEDCKKYDCDLKTAALRVFGNSEGTYGANVNHLIENSCWEHEEEIANVYASRKGFAYGVDGKPTKNEFVMENVLQRIDMAYQNLDSIEVGITTIDTYFDTLGGLSRAVKKAKGKLNKSKATTSDDLPVYIADNTQGKGSVRGISEQVALETRTRSLNPKWYEGMLSHGCEGVRQIEAQLTHTLGWSATTGQVQPWVYQQMTETFILDQEMRERISELNPQACSRVVNRLLEASKRKYWNPSDQVISSLEQVSQDLEDKLEGVTEGVST